LRNQRARYQTESTTGNRYLKAYNTFLTEKYQPAYTAAYQYKPVVDSAYRQYKSAFDTAKGEYDQLFAREKAKYESALGEAQRLQGVVTQANTNYANYKKTNLDPYEGEYARRTTAYNTAYSNAIKGAEKQYTQQANQLLSNLTVAQTNIGKEYTTTRNTMTKAYNASYDKANKALTDYNKTYASDLFYVNQQGIGNTVYNPMKEVVQRYDSAKFLGGNLFEYTIAGSKYNIKQAPSSFDVSFQYQVQDRVKKYNFYLKTIQEGNRDIYGIPSYVNDKWLEVEKKTLDSWLTPKTGLIDSFKKTGESRRAAATEAYTSVEALISQKDIAENSLKDFVSVSQADYVSSRTEKERKAYQDFTATSLEDFARPIATAATTSEAKAVQDYVSTLNAQREATTNYYNQNVQPAQNTYNQYISNTYNPAKQSYEQVANDTNYVTSRISAQKTRYESTATEFNRLKTVYEGMQPTLDQLKTDYQTSVDALSGLSSRITDLERSVQIDLDPRKSATRVGQRQSILTRGSKRAGAAR